LAHGVGSLEQSVCKGAFPVVDMSYDTEIANILHCIPVVRSKMQKYDFSPIRQNFSLGRIFLQPDRKKFRTFAVSI
jgi:hypothetical protein